MKSRIFAATMSLILVNTPVSALNLPQYVSAISKPAPDLPSITLYEGCNYSGNANKIYGIDALNIYQLQEMGVLNDSVSSIKIAHGLSVTLFEDGFFTGRRMVLEADLSCMSGEPFNFDNLTSAIKIEERIVTPLVTSTTVSNDPSCYSTGSGAIYSGASFLISAGTTLLKDAPLVGPVLSFFLSLGQVAHRSACAVDSASVDARIRGIVNEEIDETLLSIATTNFDTASNNLESYGYDIEMELNNGKSLEEVRDDYYSLYNDSALHLTTIENDLNELDFTALDLQTSVAAMKMGSINAGVDPQYSNYPTKRHYVNAKASYEMLLAKEASLESFLNAASYGYDLHIEGSRSHAVRYVRAFVKYSGNSTYYIDARSPDGGYYDTSGYSSFSRREALINNELNSSTYVDRMQDARDLWASKNHNIRERILNDDYKQVKSQLKAIIDNYDRDARNAGEGDYDYTQGYCSAKTFGDQTNHSYVKFNLPKSLKGTEIRFKDGALYKYVFPYCHRVSWTPMTFTCNDQNQWEQGGSTSHGGAVCDSQSTRQPYMKSEHF